jgi:hypothetical protein
VESTEDFYEDRYSVGNNPIRHGKLPASGAAATTPDQPTEQPRFTAEPFRCDSGDIRRSDESDQR